MDNTKEELIELLNNSFEKQYEKRGLLTALYTADDLIANGVKIPVLCKECKHYKQNPYSKEKNMMCMCWCDWLATDPDDFCSYGERRTEE